MLPTLRRAKTRNSAAKARPAKPYFNHLAQVAVVLADAGADANFVAVGHLHDAIEDQDLSHADLVDAFGLDVADLVAQVTDDKQLPKERRKRLLVDSAPLLPPLAQIRKMAGTISNQSGCQQVLQRGGQLNGESTTSSGRAQLSMGTGQRMPDWPRLSSGGFRPGLLVRDASRELAFANFAGCCSQEIASRTCCGRQRYEGKMPLV